MLEHQLEAQYEQSMAAVFAALAQELGRDRWLQTDEPNVVSGLPRAGMRFGYRQAQRLYCGQVLECLRPVSLVLVERYRGPAGSIVVRQRWRVDPMDLVTRLSGELRIETNCFARLQLRFWSAHFKSRAQRICNRVSTRLRLGLANDATGPGDSARQCKSNSAYRGATGQSNGNISIVKANITSVSGKPILR